ncbi:hypothetical protein [Psychrobacter immobilis]|uniref:hypothetical protein n=1 Tax=Psychrobacter immobilis TaxID=498 RepID=UPI001D11C435|nr:hypothetical protein [Psychrobacter immobilis]
MPHALSRQQGMQGMGKRAFVWRLVSLVIVPQARYSSIWRLRRECESCQWLRSSTHPSLQVLPFRPVCQSVQKI